MFKSIMHRMNRRVRNFALGVVVLFMASATLAGEPKQAHSLAEESIWSEWRGRGRRATAEGVTISTPLAKPPRKLWEAAVGTGWSSPVIAKGHVLTMDRRGGQERVLAFDTETGAVLWERGNAVDFDPHPVGRNHGNGPKSTPLIDGGDVFSLGIAGWLQCLDAASGAVRWSVNLPAKFGERNPLPHGRAKVVGTEYVMTPIGPREGAPVPLFGYTGSPVLAGDLLVCPVGGAQGGTIMAFNRRDGKEEWRSLSENVSYSSPVVATIAGVAQVVVMTGPRVVGLDARSGTLMWDYPFQIQYDESISTPVVDGDTVLVTGDGKPLTALRISRSAKRWRADAKWQNRDLTSYLSSMVVRDGHVYGMDDTGRFACVRINDGATVWSDGEHGTYCNPVLAGDRLFCMNERGRLLALAAMPAHYLELGAAQLGDAETWTMPAIVENRIYVRSGSGLACWVAD